MKKTISDEIKIIQILATQGLASLSLQDWLPLQYPHSVAGGRNTNRYRLWITNDENFHVHTELDNISNAHSERN